jgi:hypothetical protein
LWRRLAAPNPENKSNPEVCTGCAFPALLAHLTHATMRVSCSQAAQSGPWEESKPLQMAGFLLLKYAPGYAPVRSCLGLVRATERTRARFCSMIRAIRLLSRN